MSKKGIFRAIIGTFIMGLAISLIIHGEYGADTMSVFILGMANLISFPFGIWSMIINLIVISVAYFLAKNQLGIGSIINAFGIGLTTLILEEIVSALSKISFYNESALFLGPVLFGIGSALYVSGNQGSAGLECLTLIFTERSKISLKYIRILIDASFVIAGILLGSKAGIGTLLCVLLIGPIMEKSLTYFGRTNEIVTSKNMYHPQKKIF